MAKEKTTEINETVVVGGETAIGTKPNASHLLPKDKKIVVLGDKNESVSILLSEYVIQEGLESCIHISKVETQVPVDTPAFRLPIDQIPVGSFLTACQNNILAPTKSGTPAFRLSDNKQEAGLQAFNILLACTKHQKKGDGIEYSKDAKELVGKRFGLSSETEIVNKCNELRLLNWGNIKAFVDDIIHYPDFSGEVKIDEYCLQTTETLVKSTILPE
jgi:hypothetical protein